LREEEEKEGKEEKGNAIIIVFVISEMERRMTGALKTHFISQPVHVKKV
jgi:hypothetical protein